MEAVKNRKKSQKTLQKLLYTYKAHIALLTHENISLRTAFLHAQTESTYNYLRRFDNLMSLKEFTAVHCPHINIVIVARAIQTGDIDGYTLNRRAYVALTTKTIQWTHH